jgi:serine/threonine-protein kinase RsbW
MNEKDSSVQLKIPANAEYIDIVRLTLYGIANKWGFSYEEIEDMKVAVSEACNNAVLHAYKGKPLSFIEVYFEFEEQQIKIRVKDEGDSFEYYHTETKSSALHDKNLSEISAGGLGIYLMQALMDAVEVNTHSGTEVIMTKLRGKVEDTA